MLESNPKKKQFYSYFGDDESQPALTWRAVYSQFVPRQKVPRKLSHDRKSPQTKCPMNKNVPWTRLSRKSKYAWTWFLVSHEASFSGFVFFFWFLRLTSWTDIHCDGGSSFDQNSRQKGRLLVCSQELNLHIASRRWRQVPSRSGDVETERAMADCTLLATKSWRRPLIIICQIKLKCWFWPKGWH